MKITRKGQVTIPIAIREKLGLLPGVEIEFVVAEKDLILRRSPKSGRGSDLISAM